VLSHYLTEFHYGKFDDIEVPGQYTEACFFCQLTGSSAYVHQQTRDTNTNFVRIQKFYPKFDNCRTNGWCYRRLTMQGNDHSKTSFAVLTPAHRSWRREDRVMQAFRTFNV
jgi:transformation/transcription domain-associated protein